MTKISTSSRRPTNERLLHSGAGGFHVGAMSQTRPSDIRNELHSGSIKRAMENDAKCIDGLWLWPHTGATSQVASLSYFSGERPKTE